MIVGASIFKCLICLYFKMFLLFKWLSAVCYLKISLVYLTCITQNNSTFRNFRPAYLSLSLLVSH